MAGRMIAPAKHLLALAALAIAGPSGEAVVRDVDPALWVARDADTTIYLFGTVHLLKPGLSWFDEAVADAFARADTLVLEIATPDPAEMRTLTDRYGTLGDGPPLSARLPAGYAEKLAAATRAIGYPAGAFERSRPWVVASALSVQPLSGHGYDRALGVEAVLTDAAARAGKPVEALETLEDQYRIFADLPEATQIEMLTRVLDGQDQVEVATDQAVAAWSKGDERGLARVLADDMAQTPASVRDRLVDRRNANWATWIAARMARPGTVFVAVGSGHLAGKGSVQRLLAKRGVKVAQVRY